MKLKKLVVASMVVSSMTTTPIIFAASNQSDNGISSPSVQEKQIPISSLGGKAVFSESGVPIIMNIEYGKIVDNTYSVNLKLKAGPYWYRFLWDYGPEQAYLTMIELTNVKTGAVTYRGSNHLPQISHFLGKGNARYATCNLDTVSSINLDDRITKIRVGSYEGWLLVGPTAGGIDGFSNHQWLEWK